MNNLREAWESIVEIDPILIEFEVNPQFLQMVSPNETVVVISLNTTIGETSGMINICIPHVVLEPIIPKLSVQYWMQNEKQDREPEEVAKLEENMKKAEIPISAELGISQIYYSRFSNARYWRCHSIKPNIEDPLLIKVGEIPKFIVQPGKLNKKLAIQILETLKGGEEDNGQ